MKRTTFREDLDRAVAFHGHLCGGQIIGTRIARYALDYFGAYDSDDPGKRPDLIAYVEADRCLADAITSVAGLSLGRRRLKWMDYGKMAATFYNVATGEAIRVHTARIRPSDDVKDKIAFYESVPDSALIIAEPVRLHIAPEDLPGKPRTTVTCEVCGEQIHDGREIRQGGRVLCKACAGDRPYYTPLDEKGDSPALVGSSSKWDLYDSLIDGVPEDVLIRDVCVGHYWTYVEAEHPDGRLTMGIAYTMFDGGKASMDGRLTGRSLREVASLAKSWNWREASVGIAALNAWYATAERVAAFGGIFDEPHEQGPHGAESGISGVGGGSADRQNVSRGVDNRMYQANRTDPFYYLMDAYTGKKVTVVGHFPWVGKIAEVADLTVLERLPEGAQGDVPDPACEYVIPSQDYVFMTGVTMINKTAPRLIELARNAVCAMIGPSAIPAQQLFDAGVDILGGRIVVDRERAKEAVKQNLRFGAALQMYAIDKR